MRDLLIKHTTSKIDRLGISYSYILGEKKAHAKLKKLDKNDSLNVCFYILIVLVR